jgi:hypothetical protein
LRPPPFDSVTYCSPFSDPITHFSPSQTIAKTKPQTRRRRWTHTKEQDTNCRQPASQPEINPPPPCPLLPHPHHHHLSGPRHGHRHDPHLPRPLD